MICIDADDNSAPSDGVSLQDRFAAMRARRVAANKRVQAAEKAKAHTDPCGPMCMWAYVVPHKPM